MGCDVRSLWLALAAAAVLVWGAGCSRCHSGHYEVEHYNRHTTTSCSTDPDGYLTCDTDTIPEHCTAYWICDWTCEALDKGRAEAHPKHAAYRQIKDVVDPLCTWDGVTARVK